MCTGLEIAGGVAVVSAIAGTVAKVKGDVDSAHANADQQRRQAEIDDQNQKLADDLAVHSVQNAEFEAGKIGDSASRLEGRQRAAAASQNIDPTTGSAQLAQEGTAEISAEQATLARLQGAWDAYGYKTTGLNYARSAAAHRTAADSYDKSIPLLVAGDVAQGAGNAGGSALHWWGPAAKTGKG